MEELKNENETLKKENQELKERLSKYANPSRAKKFYENNKERIATIRSEKYYNKKKEELKNK